MADDIDIEEHDVKDHPTYKNMFPDLTTVKKEITYFSEDDKVSQQAFPMIKEIKQETISDINDENAPQRSLMSSPQTDTDVKPDITSVQCNFTPTIVNYKLSGKEIMVHDIKREPDTDEPNDLIFYRSEGNELSRLNELNTYEEKTRRVNEQFSDVKQCLKVVVEDCSRSLLDNKCYCARCQVLFPTTAACNEHYMSTHSETTVATNLTPRAPAAETYRDTASHKCTDDNVDDFERGFIEPGDGSDVEREDDFGEVNPRIDNDFLTDGPEDPAILAALRDIDAEADSALRHEIGSEAGLLDFDWQSAPEHFEGVREEFTLPPGPTFDNTDMSPLDIFLKIWDANIIAHIVSETNRYGGEMVRQLTSKTDNPYARLRRWTEVSDNEIRRFITILMLQSLVINNVEREYWYPKLEELRIGNFRALMPFNRFLLIKRCIHFVDNDSLPEHPNRLDKIMPVIEHLNKKFSSLYTLEQNIAIDESLLLWKGRLSFSQKIATKAARVGIKSYELCESRTGYLWRMEVYSGEGHVHVAQVGAEELLREEVERDEPESATSQIVLTLMRPLFNRGHTLVMDNFYNAPLLSRILKVQHKTDTMGTLRLNREFVPEGLRKKSKLNMKAGEVAFSSTKDLSVVVWMEKNAVAMISTFHRPQVGGIEKYGYYKYKPQVILDYNLSMGGIDHKDQMLHAFPVERVRNTIWYKKLFRRLVNVSIHNALVMFNHNRTRVLGNREFRLRLAKELLQTCTPAELPRFLAPAPLPAPDQMHFPAKNDKPQRCKHCHANKVRRNTWYRCSTCAVNLCIVGCYSAYHTTQ